MGADASVPASCMGIVAADGHVHERTESRSAAEAPLSETLPGEFTVGQTVHYVGPDFVFESSGVGLEHGMRGTVVGHGASVPSEYEEHAYIGVHFYGHRVPTNVTPEAVSKIPVPMAARARPKNPRSDAVWSFSANSATGRGKVEALTNRLARTAAPDSPRCCGTPSAVPISIVGAVLPEMCGAPSAGRSEGTSLESEGGGRQSSFPDVADLLQGTCWSPREGEPRKADAQRDRSAWWANRSEVSRGTDVDPTYANVAVSLSAHGRLLQKQPRANARQEVDESNDVNLREVLSKNMTRRERHVRPGSNFVIAS